MEKLSERLEVIIDTVSRYFGSASEVEISLKASPEKWSKKEILGHLIDSGVNNLKRFTEIQFEQKPYQIIAYAQDELVIANHYQHAQTAEIVGLWIAINRQMLHVMSKQTEESLSFKIKFSDDSISDLRFLMTDYVDHLEHHIGQIVGKLS
jgi:hypothetical protein